MIELSLICDACKVSMNSIIVVLDGNTIKIDGKITDNRSTHYCIPCRKELDIDGAGSWDDDLKQLLGD